MAEAEEAPTTPTVAPDDRWSAFQDPNRMSTLGIQQKKDPGPGLDVYLGKVMKQRSPRKKHEKMYKVAAHVVQLITSIAYSLTSEWKLFLKGDKRGGVKSAPLRTLTRDRYECMIPLMRPLKMNAFKVVQRGFDEMPPHRCLVQLDPSLSREEVILVRKEWEPHVDKNGFLDARGILAWFNIGVSKACSILEAESRNVSRLRFHVSSDGTAVVNVTLGQSPGTSTPNPGSETARSLDISDVGMFSVNMFPVFILDKLPTSVQIHAPVPCFGRYIPAQKQLRDLIRRDMENGTLIAILEPKREQQGGAIKNNVSKYGPSWQINMSFSEHHSYAILDEYCSEEINFRQILVVINVIREHHADCLEKLNNEILVSTMFMVAHKHFTKLETVQDWFLEIVEALCHGMDIGFLPCFYLQRQNLLKLYGIEKGEQKAIKEKLQEIATAVKEFPKNIYEFTGYVDRHKGKADSDSDSSDSDSSDDDDDKGGDDEKVGDNNKNENEQ